MTDGITKIYESENVNSHILDVSEKIKAFSSIELFE